MKEATKFYALTSGECFPAMDGKSICLISAPICRHEALQKQSFFYCHSQAILLMLINKILNFQVLIPNIQLIFNAQCPILKKISNQNISIKIFGKL